MWLCLHGYIHGHGWVIGHMGVVGKCPCGHVEWGELVVMVGG